MNIAELDSDCGTILPSSLRNLDEIVARLVSLVCLGVSQLPVLKSLGLVSWLKLERTSAFLGCDVGAEVEEPVRRGIVVGRALVVGRISAVLRVEALPAAIDVVWIREVIVPFAYFGLTVVKSGAFETSLR